MSADRRALTAASLLAVGVGVAYVVLATRHQAPVGDAAVYDDYGRLARDGHWLWSRTPYGDPHPSAWKTPGYPLWVGFWYAVAGPHPAVVGLAQAALTPVTVVLTFVLARRLTGDRRAALLAAFAVALYPMAWQYVGLLTTEALAIPLTLALLAVALDTEPTPRRAALTGVLLAVNLLFRPTALFLLLGVAVAWLVRAGVRRAAAATAIVVAVAALGVAPWLIRNHHVTGAYIMSVQDAAVAGTFNPYSAHYPGFPYAWQPITPRDRDLFDPAHPLTDAELRARLNARGYAYIRAHPESVPAAFFWNGLSRLWDVRRPAHALGDAPFEGRPRGVAWAALIAYYPIALLALAGLWRLRHRRALVAGLLALALAASVVFTVTGGTRYRAPLEPLLVILAASVAAAWKRPAR